MISAVIKLSYVTYVGARAGAQIGSGLSVFSGIKMQNFSPLWLITLSLPRWKGLCVQQHPVSVGRITLRHMESVEKDRSLQESGGQVAGGGNWSLAEKRSVSWCWG